MGWDGIRHIRDGEPVDAATAGRPDRALERRTDLLRRRVDEAELGEAVVSYDRPIAPGVAPGLAVYWDADEGRYDLALAAVAPGAGGALELDPRADCLGLCLRRLDGSSGDVLHFGRAALDLAAAVGGPVAAGRYYLSSATPGRLARQSPAVSVPVCFADGEGGVIAAPAARDFLSQHVHYRFDLPCRPAGATTPPAPGGRHVVTAADASIRGWLPAAHASFGGRAPSWAAWGYNLAAHPELAACWPPIPAGAACLFLDRGAGGVLVPTGVPGGLAAMDDAGIWWATDCHGQVPWPTDYDSGSPPPPPAGPPACPQSPPMRMTLAFAVDLFASRWSVVSSLKSASAAIRVLGPAGSPASAGPLTLDLDLGLAVAATETRGSIGLSGLAEDGTLAKTRFTEGIVAGDGLVATSSHPIAGPGVGETTHRGVVRLSRPASAAGGEAAAQVVYLRGVEPRSRSGVLYYAFPQGRESSVQLQFDLPASGLPASPTLTFRASLLGSTASALPALSLTARRLPRASSGPLPLPVADLTPAFSSNVACGVDKYVEVAAAPLAAAAGDTVLVTLTRSAADGYAGEVGLLRHGAAIGAAS